MIDRRNLLLAIVLLLAAGAPQLLVWWLKPPPKPNEMVGPPRSSYTLTDFVLDALGDDGQQAFHLVSPYLARREGDHFFEQRRNIDDDTVTDDANFLTDNSRRNEVQNVLLAVGNNGVAGIGSALKTRHDIRAFRQ